MADDGIVVYKRGEIVVPGMDDNIASLLQAIALDDLKVELHKINDHLKKQEFEGKFDERTLACTEEVKYIYLLGEWPFKPWITASFYNEGLETAYLFFNHIGEWQTIKTKQTIKLDYSNGDERLYLIRYRCDAGKTTTVVAKGKF